MKQNIRYTKIENDVFEKILEMNFTASQLKVLLAMIRKLNGFHKEEDKISISQLVELTKYSNKSIIKAQGDLVKMNILILKEKGISRVRPSIWKINKDTDSWRLVNTGSHVNIRDLTYELFPSGLVNTGSHTKENKRKQKENIFFEKDNKLQALKQIKSELLSKSSLTQEEVIFLNKARDI